MNNSINIETIIRFFISFEIIPKRENNINANINREEDSDNINSKKPNKIENADIEENSNSYNNEIKCEKEERITSNSEEEYNLNNYEIEDISSRNEREINELSMFEDYWICNENNLSNKSSKINTFEQFIASEEEDISSDY